MMESLFFSQKKQLVVAGAALLLALYFIASPQSVRASVFSCFILSNCDGGSCTAGNGIQVTYGCPDPDSDPSACPGNSFVQSVLGTVELGCVSSLPPDDTQTCMHKSCSGDGTYDPITLPWHQYGYTGCCTPPPPPCNDTWDACGSCADGRYQLHTLSDCSTECVQTDYCTWNQCQNGVCGQQGGGNGGADECSPVGAACVVASAPTANAGSAHSLTVGTSHAHSGASASDTDGNLASYSWAFTSCPSTCPSLSGSSGTISGSSATISGPTYTPNAAGDYALRLTVTDSGGLIGTANVTEGATLNATSLSGTCSASSCTAGQQNLTITWSSNDTLLNAECGGVSMGQQGGSGTSVPLFCPASPTTCTFTSVTGKSGSISCNITPGASAFCGDGSCNGNDTCTTCPGDCGSCPVSCSPKIENLTYTCPSPSTVKVYPGIYDPTGMGCSISPPNRVWRCQGTTCNPLSGTYFDYSGSLLSSFTDPVTKPNLTSWTYKIQNIASGNLSNPFSNSISCGPTLSATLSARINSTDAWSTAGITGTAPVNDVDLRAAVGGTAVGTVNFAFFDNHNDAHTAFDAAHTPPSVGAYVAKYNGVDMSSNWGPGPVNDAQTAGKLTVVTGGNYTIQILAPDTFIVSDLADYPTGDTTYWPKVVAERSVAPAAEDRLSSGVTVNSPALSTSCSVSPSSVSTGQNVTWSASASGGTGSYVYSWSGTDGLTCAGQPSSSCGSFTKSYSTAGTKTGSVIVTSGVQTAGPIACVNSVAVVLPLPEVDIRANGFNGTTPPLAYNSSVSITWCGSPASACANADSCSVTKDGAAWQAGTSGTFSTGALKKDTTYILTCTGPGGTIIDSVEVDISSSPDVKEVPPD